jgi:acetate kinase
MAMADTLVLTLNAGSSSLKFALFEPASPPRRILVDEVERIGSAGLDHAGALDRALQKVEEKGGLAAIGAVGHRIVHGGRRFDGPRRLTGDVLEELRRLATLDPDHMPAAIAIVDAMRARAPDLPQAASFDTAFHRTMPRVARLVAVPRRYEASGVERYGFHGLSYTYLVEELGRVAGSAAARARVIVAHLGSGSSAVALREGRSVDTTMGFTPTSGIPMGTRSGDLDPGVVLYLLRSEKLDASALDDLLNRRSGLLGVSESSADMRDLLAAEPTDPRAFDAVALYCWRARQAVGALATTIGGLDTLVFSGGIGEHAAPVRARIAEGLEHLGVHLDEGRNRAGTPVISADGSPCTVRVLATDEEAIIAREAIQVLRESPA